MRPLLRKYAPALLLSGALVGAPAILFGQIEGEERGIAPINSAGDFQAADIVVDVHGKNAFEARQEGWRVAQRLGWSKLWRQMHGGRGLMLPDSRLDGIVSAIEIIDEQIGPRRYQAKLNVYFDRARAGQILGVTGLARRSAPLLVIPVQVSGGAEIVFEQRTPWQQAWARYRTADSAIDYIRPRGAGAESLIVNAGQLGRRSREWWRLILDQFGAADVIMPIVEIERRYPGGPISARFIARAGPDNERLGGFTLTVQNEESVSGMLDKGIEQLDRIYMSALAAGRLRPDESLIIEDVIEEEELEDVPPPPAPSQNVSAPFDDVDLTGGGSAQTGTGGQPGTGAAQSGGQSGGGQTGGGSPGTNSGQQSGQPQRPRPPSEPQQGPRNILPGQGEAQPRVGPRSGPPRPAENR